MKPSSKSLWKADCASEEQLESRMVKSTKKMMRLFQKYHASGQLFCHVIPSKLKMNSGKLLKSLTCLLVKGKLVAIQTTMISPPSIQCFVKISTQNIMISTETLILIVKLTTFLKSTEAIQCSNLTLLRQKLKSETVLMTICRFRRVHKMKSQIPSK